MTAGLPAITGLYTSILCLLGYAVLGPSPVLVLGPDSSLGPMIAAVILPIAGAQGDPERAIALASMLGLLVGAITSLGAMARLGTRTPGGPTYDLHQGNLRIDEAATGIAARVLAEAAVTALSD